MLFAKIQKQGLLKETKNVIKYSKPSFGYKKKQNKILLCFGSAII